MIRRTKAPILPNYQVPNGFFGTIVHFSLQSLKSIHLVCLSFWDMSCDPGFRILISVQKMFPLSFFKKRGHNSRACIFLRKYGSFETLWQSKNYNGWKHLGLRRIKIIQNTRNWKSVSSSLNMMGLCHDLPKASFFSLNSHFLPNEGGRVARVPLSPEFSTLSQNYDTGRPRDKKVSWCGDLANTRL